MHSDTKHEKSTFVSDRLCPAGMVKCADNIQCMYEIHYCSGRTNCRDMSDEDPELCTSGMLSSTFH